MTPERQATIASTITDLDRVIVQHDNAASNARAQRRELRLRLKKAGWSWRELGALSGQTMFAVEKDAKRYAGQT